MLCYTTLLRPILEYSCTVWDPFTQANITKLEKIQRHFARFILNDYRWTSSVTAMIHQLQWQTLQERRAHLKVAMMYRIINSYIDIPGSYLVQATQTNRGHTMKLLVPNARTLTYQRSFFPDSIRLWNILPQEVVSCTSLELFKQQLQVIQLR